MLHPGPIVVEEIKINDHEGLKATVPARCYYDEGGIAGSGELIEILLVGDAMTYALIEVFGDDQGMFSTFKFTPR